MLAILAQTILCLCVVLPHASTNSQTPSRVIFDITQPINAFKEGKSLKTDFVEAIFPTICSNSTKHSFFYEIDADLSVAEIWPLSIEDTVSQIWQVSEILNETVDRDSTIQLMIYLNKYGAMAFINETLNVTISRDAYNFPNIYLTIIFKSAVAPDFNTKTENSIKPFKLSTIRQIFGISKDQNLQLGIERRDNVRFFGLLTIILEDDEYLIQKTDLTYVTYTTSLNDPLELEDSFKYFQQEIKSDQVYSKLKIIYRPVFCSTNCSKIHDFDMQRIYDDVPNANIVFEIPYADKRINTNQKFSVIPHLNPKKNQDTTDEASYTLMLPLALEAVEKGFSTILLKKHQWLSLKSREVANLFIRYKPIAAETQLRVIIDYSKDVASSLNISYIKSELRSAVGDDHAGINVEALVFKLPDKSEVDELDSSHQQNETEDFPESPKIGCLLRKKSFSDINVLEVVNTCRYIGGSIYILKLAVTLQWSAHKPVKDRHTYMIKLLEPVRNLRNAILFNHQNAAVYFQLDVIGVNKFITDGFSTPLTKDILDHSWFCQPALQDVNRLIVSIITWANGYNFPVILNSALSHDIAQYDDDGQWFSFLRNVPSLSTEIEQLQAGRNERPAYSFPITNTAKYKIDGCIDWIEVKPEITEDYFNNKNIGTVLHTDDVYNNGTTFEEVIVTMFKFIFHRFQLLEIVSSSNLPDVLNALIAVSEEAQNSTVFINYVACEEENEAESKKFVESLVELESSKISVVKGIHVDPLYRLNPFNISKFLQLHSIFKNKIETKKKPGLKFGILVDMEDFFPLIQFYAEESEFNDEYLVLLNQIDYVIFYQTVWFQTSARSDWHERPHVQRRLKEQLYFKRVIQKLFPHLEVYFRVFIDTSFTSDSGFLIDYLALVSMLKSFSIEYNLNSFVVEAFDNLKADRVNGWWSIKSDGNPENPKTYVEKEAEFSGRYMWYPSPSIPKETQIVPFQFLPLVSLSLSLLLLISIIFGSVLFIRYKKLRQYLSDEEINDFLNGKRTSQNNYDQNDTIGAADSMKYDSKYELQASDFNIDSNNILGMGNFGTVFKGQVKGSPVAIKQPNKDCPKGTFKSVLSEIKVLCYIGMHSHVVGFIGAYTKEIQQGILYIATELCSNGSLEKLLRTKRSVISEQEAGLYQSSQLEKMLHFSDLHRFAMEIAKGMEYIESKNIVHGDLSARNVLLDENYTCKIGDFGLSRKLYEYQKYVKKSQEPLPWKWMAVESLTKMEFTSKSDVWSYGVTLWEIYSLGEVPYGGRNWTFEFANELRNGFRLQIAQFSSQNIYEKMLKCWELNAEDRPTFSTLVLFFRGFYDTQYMVLGEL